jgi:hypothetical protein
MAAITRWKVETGARDPTALVELGDLPAGTVFCFPDSPGAACIKVVNHGQWVVFLKPSDCVGMAAGVVLCSTLAAVLDTTVTIQIHPRE